MNCCVVICFVPDMMMYRPVGEDVLTLARKRRRDLSVRMRVLHPNCQYRAHYCTLYAIGLLVVTRIDVRARAKMGTSREPRGEGMVQADTAVTLTSLHVLRPL